MDYAYRMGMELMASVWESEDAVEGARAFIEKRKPNWQMK
jgi:enoyl-CoA hydratase/carnithine racemase